MKKIVLFAFLTIGFVNCAFADLITICEKNYYYNGDKTKIAKEYKQVTCTTLTTENCCSKCPGSGVVDESTCELSQDENNCTDVHTIDDCTIAKERQDRTGYFKYDISTCKYSPKKTDSSSYSTLLDAGTIINSDAQDLGS